MIDVKKWFEYREDGHLYWKFKKGRALKGNRFGVLDSCGYIRGRLNRINYLEHVLVWLYHYNEFPKTQLDHINKINIDNRIENLREVTASENGYNKGAYKNNKIGIKNLFWENGSKRWKIVIKKDKKVVVAKRYQCLGRALHQIEDLRICVHGDYVRHK
jgi:HNH endonuclease